MFESTMASMLGVVPVAMTGGIVLGLSQEALRIPGRINQMQVSEETVSRRRPRRKARTETDSLWQRIYGIPTR